MKKPIFSFIAGFALCASLAFTNSSVRHSMGTGEAKQIDGLYVFTDSSPLAEHEKLGTVTFWFIWDTQYESIRNKLIMKAKQQFPEADAIIIQPNKKGLDEGIAIKFKKD